MSSATSHDVENPKQPAHPEQDRKSCNLGDDLENLDRRLAEALTDRPPKRGPARILIVGDKIACTGDLDAWLEKRRHQCVTARRLDEARAEAARKRFDLIILNPDLPDGDGLELLRLVQRTSPATKSIVISEDTSSQTVLNAMRCGAIDFLNTPTMAQNSIDNITNNHIDIDATIWHPAFDIINVYNNYYPHRHPILSMRIFSYKHQKNNIMRSITSND